MIISVQITSLLFPITFIITYGIAVSLGHADLLWPYISDTGELLVSIRESCSLHPPGTMPPESCIFGQLMNIGAVLLCFIFYTRYKQVKSISL